MESEVIVNNKLIPIDKINVPDFFANKSMVDAVLCKIVQKANEHVPDLSTATSRKAIASNAMDVARSKTFLDGLGKQLADKQKADAKITDSNRKVIRDTLDALKTQVRKPLTDWETAEKEREERELAKKQYLEDWESAISENDIFDRRREVERKEAEIAKKEAERKAAEEATRLKKERVEREERIKKEAAVKARIDAEEAARLEKEEVERQRQEAIKEKILAEERAKKEVEIAEQRRLEAIKKAEEEKQKAIIEAQRKERERIEAEQLAKAEAEAKKKAESDRLAKHKTHQRKINNEAFASLVRNGYDENTAKNIIKLIANGKILHVTINY